MRLIAITGFKGSGKSEVARHLVTKYGYTRVSFTDPLKKMLLALGLTEAHLYGNLKEAPCKLLCGETPRHVMETLGTEWGRRLVHDRLWINLWWEEAKKILGKDGKVVADDLRFPNEAEEVMHRQGKIWKIYREGYRVSPHESEALIDSILTQVTYWNTGTISDLESYVDRRLTSSYPKPSAFARIVASTRRILPGTRADDNV